MGDPVGAVGTAIAVASLLYNTCQTICDVIGSYKKAPKEYHDLSADLEGLSTVLASLRSALRGADDNTFSQEQRDSFAELKLPLITCNRVCEDFHSKLSDLKSHSNQTHTSFWDRLRLHFNKSDVSLLREKLSSTQGTLQVALTLSNLKVVTQSQTTLDTVQATTATTLSEFNGKFEALTTAVESLSIAGVTISPQDVELVKRTLDKHGELLKQCMKFCISALNATTTTPATRVKYAKAKNKAEQFIGNLGSEANANVPDVIVDQAEADSSVMGIGNISVEALKVLKGM
ncbi:hypothetical protein QBC43DRAFT_318666, partial [Cladorrhinum sp. PSN259]